MNRSCHKGAALTLGCCTLLVWAALLVQSGGSGPHGRLQETGAAAQRETALAVATIQSRLWTLRGLERDMLSVTANPQKARASERKWHAVRGNIDEIVRRARNAATDSAARNRIERLAALASLADRRMQQVSAIRRHYQDVTQLDNGEKR